MSDVSISYEDSVLQFHLKYGHLTSKEPTLDIPDNVKRLRHNLIMEEVQETVEAMGFFQEENDYATFKPEKQNLEEIADGIADSIYVLVGTAISYGIPIDRVFREVQNSNMTKTPVKVEPGQKYGTKTPKGKDYIPPHIWRILYEPEFETELEKRSK